MAEGLGLLLTSLISKGYKDLLFPVFTAHKKIPDLNDEKNPKRV